MKHFNFVPCVTFVRLRDNLAAIIYTFVITSDKTSLLINIFIQLFREKLMMTHNLGEGYGVQKPG